MSATGDMAIAAKDIWNAHDRLAKLAQRLGDEGFDSTVTALFDCLLSLQSAAVDTGDALTAYLDEVG
jgi:hypothetical protein